MEARQASVHWLMVPWKSVPGTVNWLHADEKAVLGRFRFAKKRRDWLLGRWTAKQALLARMQGARPGLETSRIAVLPAEDGAPEAWLDGQRLEVCLSLSHSSGMGLCAIGGRGLKIGCDLEKIEPRSPALVKDFFTPREQKMVNDVGEEQAPLVANLIWSAKESALKAMRTGLRVDPRKVQIDCAPHLDKGAWNPLRVTVQDPGMEFFGAWRVRSGFVLTMVSDHRQTDLVELNEKTPE